MKGDALQWKTGKENLVLCVGNCSSLLSGMLVPAPRWGFHWSWWLSVLSRKWWAASVLPWHGFLSPQHISRTWPWAPSCSDLLGLPCSFYCLLGPDPSCWFVSDLFPCSDVWLLDPLHFQLLKEFHLPTWVLDFALAPSLASPFPSSLHFKLCQISVLEKNSCIFGHMACWNFSFPARDKTQWEHVREWPGIKPSERVLTIGLPREFLPWAFLILASQLSSVTQSCLTLWDPMDCSTSLSITNSWSFLKLISINLVMPSNHLILFCPLLLLPSIFASIRVFSNESILCIRWPKYWSFSFSISPSNEYSDWFPLGLTGLISLQSKGLFKSLLQHHSSKASVSSSALSFLY